MGARVSRPGLWLRQAGGAGQKLARLFCRHAASAALPGAAARRVRAALATGTLAGRGLEWRLGQKEHSAANSGFFTTSQALDKRGGIGSVTCESQSVSNVSAPF